MNDVGFTAKVIRVGNSLGVCIPANTVKLLGITTDDLLHLKVVAVVRGGGKNGNKNSE